jgi:hypothetical protein
MNKRIKELLDQCTNPELTTPWPLVDTDKFAELIVIECAMFVVTELEGKVGSAIADATANRLEEYFGVAE